MYRFVVGFERNGKWVPVFAAESKRKTCRIRKARWCSVDYLGNQGQRLKSSRTKLSNSNNDAKS